MIRTVHSEYLKLRTTSTWWLFGIGIVVMTALALLTNALMAHVELQPVDNQVDQSVPVQDQAAFHQSEVDRYNEAHSAAGLARIAASLYTSGQFFGLLFVLLLGALIVTNEYFHQTATASFLTTARRSQVIMAKFVVGALVGTLYWAVSTAIDLVVGPIVLNGEHVDHQLGTTPVTQSILLNLAAYVLWAVLGVGLGTLIRNQIGAVVTGAVVYLLGQYLVRIVFQLIRHFLIDKDWVDTAQVVIPAVASSVMVTPGGQAIEHAPPQWVGAAVLIGYAVLLGTIGTMITRRRDIG